MVIRTLFLACILTLSSSLFAQDKPLSPPKQVDGKAGDAVIEIAYNAPSARDREIWGGLVPYDKVWRTGANEATRFTIDQDILIEGEALPAGEYALFTIPGKEMWTIIFNKDPKQWGAYKYNKDLDALRVEVKAEQTDDHEEQMLFEVEGDMVSLQWGKLRVPFMVAPAK